MESMKNKEVLVVRELDPKANNVATAVEAFIKRVTIDLTGSAKGELKVYLPREDHFITFTVDGKFITITVKNGEKVIKRVKYNVDIASTALQVFAGMVKEIGEGFKRVKTAYEPLCVVIIDYKEVTRPLLMYSMYTDRVYDIVKSTGMILKKEELATKAAIEAYGYEWEV